MKRFMGSAAIGGAIGAIASMLFFVLINQYIPLKTVDMLSFVLGITAIVLTALTLIGGFTIVNTWNDIDARTKTIIDKYYGEAKEALDKDTSVRQAELEAGVVHARKAMDEVVVNAKKTFNVNRR